MAQVTGHRLLGGDDHEDLLTNLTEELVQILVLGADLLSRDSVSTPERVERSLDLRLDQCAHAHQRLAKAGELSFEREAGHRYPNRPVM